MEISSSLDDFRCPISLEVMSDPVILTSGHTFDRPSIQRWLDSGKLTCPVTNLPLHRQPSLIPNHALRRIISNYAPTDTIKYQPSPPDPDVLTLSFPSDTDTLSSLLRNIKKSPAFRRRIADSKNPSLLLRHVSAGERPDLQKLAIHSLLYLSLDTDDVKVGLVAEGAVDHLVVAVKSDGLNSSSAAAATVITSLATVDVNKAIIGAHPAAISSLAAMLLEGSSKREKKEAATAIYELSKFPENRRRVVRTGVVRELVKLAGSGLDRAAEVLSLLAKTREGREEMGKIKGFVRVLAGVVESGTQRGAENAMAVLSLVAREDGSIATEARRVLESAIGRSGSEKELLTDWNTGFRITDMRGEKKKRRR